jgi:hypothetical protein
MFWHSVGCGFPTTAHKKENFQPVDGEEVQDLEIARRVDDAEIA